MKYPFENLPLYPPGNPSEPGGFLVNAIVEQPAGTTVRTVWDEEKREFVNTGLVLDEPLPGPYGWFPQTLCEGDGDALDVLILTEKEAPQGHFMAVKPVGVLLRADRDHKVLAIDPEHPRYRHVQEYNELPQELLTYIEDWFRPYFVLEGWAGSAGAREMIGESHAAFLKQN